MTSTLKIEILNEPESTSQHNSKDLNGQNDPRQDYIVPIPPYRHKSQATSNSQHSTYINTDSSQNKPIAVPRTQFLQQPQHYPGTKGSQVMYDQANQIQKYSKAQSYYNLGSSYHDKPLSYNPDFTQVPPVYRPATNEMAPSEIQRELERIAEQGSMSSQSLSPYIMPDGKMAKAVAANRQRQEQLEKEKNEQGKLKQNKEQILDWQEDSQFESNQEIIVGNAITNVTSPIPIIPKTSMAAATMSMSFMIPKPKPTFGRPVGVVRPISPNKAATGVGVFI